MKFVLLSLLFVMPVIVLADDQGDIICDQVTGLSESDLENKDLHEIIMSCLAPLDEKESEERADAASVEPSVASK